MFELPKKDKKYLIPCTKMYTKIPYNKRYFYNLLLRD